MSGACALIVVGSAHAVRAVQTVDQPDLAEVAFVDRAVPAGACTVSDNPAVLLLANRFSAPKGCTDLVDADGSTLAWSAGRRGKEALSARPPSSAGSRSWKTDRLPAGDRRPDARADPKGPTLLGYLHEHFRMASDAGGIVVWARPP